MYNDFEHYATSKLGVSKMQIEAWSTLQNRLYGPQASLTPYILEEREMRATQMDIFSRLMMERIIWVSGVVNDAMSTVVQAQLMYLDSIDDSDITIHVDSPGGSVKSGLSMVDTINYINSDVITVNTGMAASMGSILLGCGTKGKRSALPNSRVMLHQVSSGAQGHVEDMKISLAEAEKYNTKLFDMLGEYTGKKPAQVLKDANRDMWLNAEEAKAYGIIDEVVYKKSKK